MNMNQKGFANIILVVVIVVLVGAVGYFAFVKKSEPIVQQPTPTPTQTNTPVSPTPAPKDEMSNWKTYKNTLYGVELKYLNDWSFVSQHNSLIDFGLGQPKEGSGSVVLDLNCTFASDVEQAKTFTVNYPNGTGPNENCQYINLIARTTGAVDVATQMKSTLKFISAGATSSWKTYRVSGYNGYEFQYPQSSTLVTGNELQNKILNPSGYWGARGGATEVAVLSSQSTFSVGRHGYIANLADCKKVTWPNDQTEELTTTKVINGITYYFGTYTGAAAGTQTRFNVYHAFGGSGGDGCFELVVSVSPLSGSTKVSDQILSTFKFTK